MHDFPVPALPITRNLKRKSERDNYNMSIIACSYQQSYFA